MRNAIAILIVSLAVLLPACSGTGVSEYLPDQRLQYKKQREATENLEIPPDLTTGSFDDAMDVPPLQGAATYSEYVGERSQRRQVAERGDVLPQVKDVTIKREGDNRWLEIKAPPQQVWPQAVAFWRAQGILLLEENPTTGIMKTDWLENRAEIRKDFITNTLRKVADGLYSTATRDQYRVRIEPGLDAGTTDLYLTHRGMEERLRGDVLGDTTSTIWVPMDPDPDKEAAMLRRLMVHLGASEQRAAGLAPQEGAAAGAAKSQLTTGPGGERELVIAEEFRRAWRLTGVALDRIGFAVEDRDRAQGIYYVRYDDPTAGEEKKGWGSRLAFWRGKDEKGAARYQVKLNGDGTKTRVSVRDQVGQPAPSGTADRILGLLHEELR